MKMNIRIRKKSEDWLDSGWYRADGDNEFRIREEHGLNFIVKLPNVKKMTLGVR